MKLYHFINLETEEENRVDYSNHAEIIDFQIFKSKKEAINKFNATLKELTENNKVISTVDFHKNCHKKDILKDFYFNGYEFFQTSLCH